MSSHAASPRVRSRDLYPWASSELLDECSCLLATRDIREHKGDSCSYDHRAFARRHDDDIVVLPCTLGEPVCGDERANEGVPFFYLYQVVFKTIGVRLPFSWSDLITITLPLRSGSFIFMWRVEDTAFKRFNTGLPSKIL